jgi:2-methylisocitrate lyase-like PEP mutase family enzyme
MHCRPQRNVNYRPRDDAAFFLQCRREAGADMLWVEAPIGHEQTKAVARRLKGIPLLCNIAASGKTPDIPTDELGRIGHPRMKPFGFSHKIRLYRCGSYWNTQHGCD